MASPAQIDANRRNASRSTGPKTEAGKARSRLNGLKNGTHARTVNRVLPQEKAGELEEHINKWLSDLKPRNDAERDLVIQAAKLLWERKRARRCGTARLATRVCRAQLSNSQGRLTEVGELARRLLYNAGPKTLPTEGRPWEDNPAACLSGLEKSAEGCRWLLDRWIGLRVLLDRKSEWTYGDMFCLIRLLGKYPIEAINDPNQHEDMAHTPDSVGENRTQFRDEDSCGHGLDNTLERYANESFAAVDVQPESGPRWRPRQETEPLVQD